MELVLWPAAAGVFYGAVFIAPVVLYGLFVVTWRRVEKPRGVPPSLPHTFALLTPAAARDLLGFLPGTETATCKPSS